MSSKSSGSCLGSAFLLVIILAMIRYALPTVWKFIAGIFTGTIYFGLFLLVAFFVTIGYFTYRNLKSNRKEEEEKKFAPVSRTDALYQSVVQKLQQDMVLNQVSAEEFLQSEILVSEILQGMKKDLIRLKDFASPANEKLIAQQIRDYKQQLQQSSDSAVQEVIQENLNLLGEKQERIQGVKEEIRQKEASIDLIYNSLINVDEDLKFGRVVQRLFPPDLYRRFGLTPPSDQRLPPLTEKSSDA